MLRKLIFLCVFFGIMTLSSCGLSGPKPDKRIDVELKLDAAITSEEEKEKAIVAIKNRFEKFGAFPKVVKVPNTNTLNFTLETYASEERVLKFLSAPGNLEFYLVRKADDITRPLLAADEMLKESDSLEAGPILQKIADVASSLEPHLFRVAQKDTGEISSILNSKRLLNLLPSDLKQTKFLWGRLREGELISMYAVQTNNAGSTLLNSGVVNRTLQGYDATGRPVIDIQMNSRGAALWEDLTKEAYNTSTQIAIVIDDQVISAPGVMNGPITGGRSQISGDFTESEAQDLAATIGAGSIPKMKILTYTVIPLE